LQTLCDRIEAGLKGLKEVKDVKGSKSQGKA
jgi:hypothetical protein